MLTTTSTATGLDSTLRQYQRFWVVTESLTPRIYTRSELEEAIAEFQHLLRNSYSARFLSEKVDYSLYDLSLFKPAVH